MTMHIVFVDFDHQLNFQLNLSIVSIAMIFPYYPNLRLLWSSVSGNLKLNQNLS